MTEQDLKTIQSAVRDYLRAQVDINNHGLHSTAAPSAATMDILERNKVTIHHGYATGYVEVDGHKVFDIYPKYCYDKERHGYIQKTPRLQRSAEQKRLFF